MLQNCALMQDITVIFFDIQIMNARVIVKYPANYDKFRYNMIW